jgi:hypothetical protein
VAERGIVFLSGDLVFAARVRAVCERLGEGFYFGSNLPAADVALPFQPSLVVLDLSTRSGLTMTLVDEAKARYPETKTLAFAPHVHKERLRQAGEASFDQVMTRGQFDSWLNSR